RRTSEPTMNLEACLPAHLQGPKTKNKPITVGISGAPVFRVETAGDAIVLNISEKQQPLSGIRRKAHLLNLAADARLAPPVVQIDEAERAIVSAFVVDRSFPAFFAKPETREAALAKLGQTIRRVHDLPRPEGGEPSDPRGFLSATWSGLTASFATPAFA